MGFKPSLHIVEGGVGKHLMFTCLLNKLVEKYKQKLCLMSGFPELFKHDSRIVQSHTHTILPIHDYNYEMMRNYNEIIFKEPYKSNFLHGEKHLCDAWAEMYDIEIDSFLPDYVINVRREKEIHEEILKLGKFALVQFTGGQAHVTENYDEENAGRNYRYGQEVINLLKEELPNLNIIAFSQPNESEPLTNTTAFQNFGGIPKFVDKSDFMILAGYCSSFICIDSSLQHICSNKRFNKKGVVLWGSSNPKQFGYSKNINLRSEYPYAPEIKPQKVVDAFLEQKVDTNAT